jgi:hypothetical protein
MRRASKTRSARHEDVVRRSGADVIAAALREEKMSHDVFPAAVQEQDSAQYVVRTGRKRLLS